jgi:3-hydroxymyristoyl/3-hydroxydecanoyl-(acyl carrier protein) dehydratase
MASEKTPQWNTHELLKHRGIAMALDEITDLEPGVSATGLWTPGEEYFEGHFPEPDKQILPGPWQVESVALIGACALLAQRPGLLPMFRENNSKFKGQVEQGDTLVVSAVFGDVEEVDVPGGGRMLVASGSGKAKVNGKTVYHATLIKAVADISQE